MEKKPDKGLNSREIEKIHKFGYNFALGMALLTAVGIWKGFALYFIVITAFLAVYHFIFALLNYVLLVPTYYVTGFIGRALGNILTTIIFSAVFYVLFTPISVLLRAAGKDVIRQNSINPRWKDIPSEDNSPEKVKKLF